jgi:hypothetical protein
MDTNKVILIVLAVIVLVIIIKPRVSFLSSGSSGYSNTGRSIFDLDELAWLPRELRDQINSIDVPALRSVYAKYNNGNGLTQTDKTNLQNQMTQMVSIINAIPTPSPAYLVPPTNSVKSSIPSGWSSKPLTNGLTNSLPPNVTLETSSGIFSQGQDFNNFPGAQAMFISDNGTFVAAYKPVTGSSVVPLNTPTTTGTLTTLSGVLYYNPFYFSVS